MPTTYAIRRQQQWLAITWDGTRNQVTIDQRTGGRFAYSPVGEESMRAAREDYSAVTYGTLRELREDHPDAERWRSWDRKTARSA